MYAALTQFLNQVFPTCCMVCNRTIASSYSLCQECEQQLPWMEAHCHGCGLAFPEAVLVNNRCGQCLSDYADRGHALDRCHSLFHYSSPLNNLIPAFKFQARFDIGHCFASLMAVKLAAHFHQHGRPDLLLPVPLHYRRYRERGFNQSWELVKTVSRHTAVPCSNTVLLKQKHTAAQSDLGSARERRRNLTNAFVLHPNCSLESVTTVTIIDDVITTMSTVNNLAGLLKAHGIQGVEAWSIARAGT
ncbi:MAG: ComF family protein [Gammaproteobacteria bacterium]